MEGIRRALCHRQVEPLGVPQVRDLVGAIHGQKVAPDVSGENQHPFLHPRRLRGWLLLPPDHLSFALDIGFDDRFEGFIVAVKVLWPLNTKPLFFLFRVKNSDVFSGRGVEVEATNWLTVIVVHDDRAVAF